MPLFLGQLINNRYRIDAVLEQDEKRALYQAWDMSLNMAVAVLENLDSGSEASAGFGRQAEKLAPLSHPNLPRVINYFSLPGQGQYLVTDPVEGESLQSLLDQQGVLPQTEALDWIGQIAEALLYLRRRAELSISPDLSLANIWLQPDGRVMLRGVAPFAEETESKDRPVLAGYSPPERYGQEQPDDRSDVYLLGAMLYHLLTGQMPPESVSLATGSARLAAPGQLNQEISPTLERTILRAMAPAAERRFESLAAFRSALLQLRYKPFGSMPSFDSQAGQPALKFLPILLGGVGFVLGLIIASAIYLALPGGSAATDIEPASESGAILVQNTPTPLPSATLSSLPTPTATPLVAAPPISDSGIETLPDLSGEGLENTPLQVVTDTLTGAALVLVPAGPFMMGGASGGEDAQPAHLVTLNQFFIDRLEVTNGQYAACVAAGACQPPANPASYTRPSYYDNPEYDAYPVLQVSWDQAATFCAWRGGHLPTEAEWEKAARGGDERRYPWGETLDCSVANWAAAGGACVGDTAAVGSYPAGASPYGVLDMAGNVWEWTADWYAADYYAAAPEENPRGPETGEFKVLRGGSWVSNELNLQTTFRNSLEPASASSNIGFRCLVRP